MIYYKLFFKHAKCWLVSVSVPLYSLLCQFNIIWVLRLIVGREKQQFKDINSGYSWCAFSLFYDIVWIKSLIDYEQNNWPCSFSTCFLTHRVRRTWPGLQDVLPGSCQRTHRSGGRLGSLSPSTGPRGSSAGWAEGWNRKGIQQGQQRWGTF